MNEVEEFIFNQDENIRELMLFLHNWLTIELKLTPKIRYKIPFYDGRTWICLLNITKTTGVELAFIRGKELSNKQGLLKSKGRKQVYGIDFNNATDIPMDALYEIMQEAILLDRRPSFSVQKKK